MQPDLPEVFRDEDDGQPIRLYDNDVHGQKPMGLQNVRFMDKY